MARITVEDCLDHVDQRNRFHLALIASRRARQLRNGARPLVHSEEDDFTVLALREIAGGRITLDFLDQIDRDLEGIQDPGGGGTGEPSAESVAEAAEALGAGMAAGVGGAGRESATLEGEEEGEEAELETAPEEPELSEDAEGEAEEPEDEEPSDEDEE